MRAFTAILLGMMMGGGGWTAEYSETDMASAKENRAWLTRLQDAADAARSLPQAKETLLRMKKSKRIQEYLSILEGKTSAESDKQKTARSTIEELVLALECAPHWKPSPAYPIVRRTSEVVIDGHCEESDWEQAETALLCYAINSNKPSDMPCATARLLWDDTYLYAAFEVPDVSIVAPSMPRDSDVFLNDCVELFLLPSKRFGSYWELNVSPSGSVMDQFCTKYQDAPLSYFHRDLHIEGLRHASQIHRDADGKITGYTVEIAVPLDQLPGLIPREGAVIWVLMARADRNRTEEPLHFYSHAPMLDSFHNIWTLPQAIFVSTLPIHSK